MTYNDLFANKNIIMWVDLSTYCNAACPQCHRTNPTTLEKVDWLQLDQWSLDRFITTFPKSIMANISSFDFCGTWGDPIMNKDIMEICKYVIDNSNSLITINTNGSIRDEDWWWELGSYCKERLTIVFAIDGSTQNIHSHYRQNTFLEKILANMSAAAYATANCKVFTVLFKHNQDDIINIAKISKMYGAKTISIIQSNRFELGPKTRFLNNQTLEKTTLPQTLIDAICNKNLHLTHNTIHDLEQILNAN